jgi:hypothetical protein
MLPRSIDLNSLSPSQVVREPGRFAVERIRAPDSYISASSILEVTTTLDVRLREGLWEGDGSVDFTSTCTFALACLAFAARLYQGTAVTGVEVRIGMTNALGRRLSDDPTKFTGFFQTYTATSPADLTFRRSTTIEELADAARRTELARSIVDDIAIMFGFRLNDDSWLAHLRPIGQMMPDLNVVADGLAG